MLFVVAFALTGMAQGRKPNVLFLMSDDLNTALSGFGHPQCKTPMLDQLAADGVRFENMHCQYPVCGASRSSIMSGLYPYTNGTLANAGTLRGNMPDVVTMSQLFRQNGYHVGRVSKICHMGIPNEIIAGTAERDDPHSWDEVVNIKAPEQNAPGKKTNRSDKRDFISAIVNGTDVMIDIEAGHRVNSQCLLGLATVKAGERLEWDPKAEKVTNSVKGEELMKESFYRDPWKLENFV